MRNLAVTYQHIADILSFKTSNEKLEKTLSNPHFDWDAIVIEGSKHLVLPAIYCRLKAKELLHILPEDLNTYLNEITKINRNRNKAIINQAHSLSELLKKHNIEHVFLKGTALLTLGYYKDNAERMIGDIDILIEKSQLEFTFQLIKENGYNKTYGFAYNKNNYRHLDRLIAPNELAAIELHSELLNKKFRHLLDVKKVLSTKVNYKGIFIPNSFNLNKHQVLGWQLNDKGYYYNKVNFKILYDTIILKAHRKLEIKKDLLIRNKYCKYYFEIARLYFKELHSNKLLNQKGFRVIMHEVTMKFSILRKLILWLKSLFSAVSHRLYLIKSNKSYRKHLYCKIFPPNKR